MGGGAPPYPLPSQFAVWRAQTDASTASACRAMPTPASYLVAIYPSTLTLTLTLTLTQTLTLALTLTLTLTPTPTLTLTPTPPNSNSNPNPNP